MFVSVYFRILHDYHLLEIFITAKGLGCALKKCNIDNSTLQDRELATKFPSWKGLLSVIEFRAFLGLWLMRGLWGQATSRLSNLYLPSGLPIFSATMPRERYKWILRHLSFDGTTRTEERYGRWKNDRLAAIRYLFESIVDRWGRPMVPDEHLTIDETLYNLYTQVSN